MSGRSLESPEDVASLLADAWAGIVADCRSVLGSELHYQAMIYAELRRVGAPRGQIGMNVKQFIEDPITDHFRALGQRKHELYRGGFEPIPDIVLFGAGIAGDWRRRNNLQTLRHMIGAIEVKASERSGGRLMQGEILRDMRKLAAHRAELEHLGRRILAVTLVVDTAPEAGERMTTLVRSNCRAAASDARIGWLYVSPQDDECTMPT
jgi:hypothetical protein